MQNIELLDCTLRDGGYVNDWEFGHNNLISIYERLVDAGVDIIELGFLDDRRPYDWNRSIFPDTQSASKIWAGVNRKPPMLVGMIDYGTCDIKNIQPCEESLFDGIRVIFKKHMMHEALEYCAQIKMLGYKVFAQLVSITAYDDDELMELIGLVNDVKPYAVSMVDTYGLLNPHSMIHIYEILDKNVDASIGIGFHAHNNFQLAYANCIAFLEKKSKRSVVVDGTLYGMGKSAGNAPIELLMMELNDKYHGQYNIRPVLESIEESIMDFYKDYPWGYKLFFYLSAKNRCHPSYVGDYQKKQNLSLTDIDTLLNSIEPKEKKLLYDEGVSQSIYEDYYKEKIDDTMCIHELKEVFEGESILLIGPGRNIQLQENRVSEYIEEYHPIVISINYIPSAFFVDYVFTTNRKRYQQMTDALHEKRNQDVSIIATSNISCAKDGHNIYRVNRAPLLEKKERIIDNSLLMLMKILKSAGVMKVACAGFDGYSDKEVNYYNPSMEYSFVRDEAKHLNHHVRDALAGEFADIQVEFVTYSHYMEKEDSHEAAF